MASGKLSQKVAIVTGAGQGFGEGITRKYVEEGASVVLVDMRDEPARKVAASLPSDRTVFVRADVTKTEDWQKIIETALGKFGRVDIVVNNAGVVHISKPSIDVSETDYDRMMDINMKQLWVSTRLLVPLYRKQGGGVFVNISSVSAPRPRPGLVWYAASKGAVSVATKGLAAELAPDNIRSNAILPVVGDTSMMVSLTNGVDTPELRNGLISRIPLGRLCQPRDIANAACFLGSDESSFITGVELPVDGGRSLN